MSKSLIKPTKNEVSQKSKTRCENPYKTCRKWRLFEPKTQKGFQNDQKSITFIDETHTAFRYVKKPCKTNENYVSQKPKTRCGNPYKTCVKLMIFESKSQKGLQNDQESITFIDKTHMAFDHVEKPYKPVENRCFQGAKTSKMVSTGALLRFEKTSVCHSAFWKNLSCVLKKPPLRFEKTSGRRCVE